jgi:protein-disulfide isomerase
VNYLLKKIITIFLPVLAFVACTRNSSKDLSLEIIRPLSGDQVVIEYSGGKITAEDVQKDLDPIFQRTREQLLSAYVRAAEDLLVKKMASKEKSNDPEVSNAELQNYMHSNKIPPSDTEKIRAFLKIEKNRIDAQIGRLKLLSDLNVKNKLGSARYEVATTSSMPSKGGTGAKVTVQVFCDFGNPICNRSRLIMAEIYNQHGEKVKWIYRHFPVPSNPLGKEAALISICAHHQNMFWQVHDAFYNHQAGQTAEGLMKVAIEAGAKEAELSNCINTQAAKDELTNEIKAADALGLTQTPVYFVNGTKITDIDVLKASVDQLILK